MLADYFPLASIGLVAPDPGFVSIEQVRQHLAIRHVGRGGRRRDRFAPPTPRPQGANQLVDVRYGGTEHDASRLAFGAGARLTAAALGAAGANALLYGFLAAAGTVRAWAGVAATENFIGFVHDVFPFKLS